MEQTCFLDTPAGRLSVTVTDRAVTAIRFCGADADIKVQGGPSQLQGMQSQGIAATLAAAIKDDVAVLRPESEPGIQAIPQAGTHAARAGATRFNVLIETQNAQAETHAVIRSDAANSEARSEMGSPLLEQVARELDEYFAGGRRDFTFPVAPAGTAFQQAVWEALRTIPYGQTRTYKQIAEQIGRPAACRAVGMANNRNPIPVVIPCHRVVGSDGALVGYAGGLTVKQILLDLERGE